MRLSWLRVRVGLLRVVLWGHMVTGSMKNPLIGTIGTAKGFKGDTCNNFLFGLRIRHLTACIS